MLGKKLPSLALSLTDLIVRQKQVTVGLPGREIIISRPLGALELKEKIVQAHEGDVSTSALSQVKSIHKHLQLNIKIYFHTQITVNIKWSR